MEFVREVNTCSLSISALAGKFSLIISVSENLNPLTQVFSPPADLPVKPEQVLQYFSDGISKMKFSGSIQSRDTANFLGFNFLII